MILNGKSLSSRIFNGKTLTGRLSRDLLSTENLNYITNPKTVIVTGSNSGTTTINDVVFATNTGATTQMLSDVIVNFPVDGYGIGVPSFSSSNTSVGTINSNGIITPVSSGTANITISVSGLNTRIVPITVTQQNGITSSTFQSFVSGSVSYDMANQVDTAISGLSPGAGGFHSPGVGIILGTNQSLFSSWSPSTSTFVRNSGLFESAIDLSCLAASYNQGTYFGGTLISPQHFITANHNLYDGNAAGSTLWFVDINNNTYTGTVSTGSQFVNVSGTDIAVVKLDNAIPSGIKPVSFLPSNYSGYIFTPQYGVPCVSSNQFKTLSICELTFIAGGFINVNQPANTNRASWYSPTVQNDSSSPIFAIIGEKCVILSCWFTTGGGPSYADYLTQIQSAMTSLGGGYSLSTISLSGYIFY